MISFFPETFYGEAFISVIARYHEMAGYTSVSYTLNDWFSTSHLKLSAVLPAGLEVHLRNNPWQAPPTNRLLREHTAYPYFSAISFSDMNILLKSMLQFDRHMKSPVSITSKWIGRIPLPQVYRFCHECVSRDREIKGMCYWHTSHQLPGVLVCPEHRVILSYFPSEALPSKLISLERALSQDKRPSKICLDYGYSKALEIAEDSFYLLRSTPKADHVVDIIRECFASQLHEMGYRVGEGLLHKNKITEHWELSYPTEFRERLGFCKHFSGNPVPVIKAVLDVGSRQQPHPLLVLMLLRMLGRSIQEMSELQTMGCAPNAMQPSYCINYQCPDFGSVIDIVEEQKKSIAYCRCCGMKFLRSEKHQKQHLILDRGELWLRELRLLIERGDPLKQISKVMHAAPDTIKRIAVEQGIKIRWKQLETSNAEMITLALLKRRRTAWNELRQRYRGSGRTRLRSEGAALWKWLYRNDRKWLIEHSPAYQRESVLGKEKRFNDEDKQLCLRLLVSMRQLDNTAGMKPKRYSKSWLVNRLNMPRLGANTTLAHYPKLVRLINRLEESQEHFVLRRIAWCENEFVEEGFIPNKTEFYKRFGLSTDIRYLYADEISSALVKITQLVNYKGRIAG